MHVPNPIFPENVGQWMHFHGALRMNGVNTPSNCPRSMVSVESPRWSYHSGRSECLSIAFSGRYSDFTPIFAAVISITRLVSDTPSTAHPAFGEQKKGPGPKPEALRPTFGRTYQVRQPPLAGIIGWPTLHPNALPNSSKFCTEPLVLHFPGLCGSVLADTRADCSVRFSHQI